MASSQQQSAATVSRSQHAPRRLRLRPAPPLDSPLLYAPLSRHRLVVVRLSLARSLGSMTGWQGEMSLSRSAPGGRCLALASDDLSPPPTKHHSDRRLTLSPFVCHPSFRSPPPTQPTRPSPTRPNLPIRPGLPDLPLPPPASLLLLTFLLAPNVRRDPTLYSLLLVLVVYEWSASLVSVPSPVLPSSCDCAHGCLLGKLTIRSDLS